MIPDPAPPFEVQMSDNLRDYIRGLLERAVARGIGDTLRNAVSDLLTALRVNPRRTGDPLRNLRGMSSTLYRIYRNGLIAHYTVHDRIPMVTIWRFETDRYHPLAPPPPNGE